MSDAFNESAFVRLADCVGLDINIRDSAGTMVFETLDPKHRGPPLLSAWQINGSLSEDIEEFRTVGFFGLVELAAAAGFVDLKVWSGTPNLSRAVAALSRRIDAGMKLEEPRLRGVKRLISRLKDPGSFVVPPDHIAFDSFESYLSLTRSVFTDAELIEALHFTHSGWVPGADYAALLTPRHLADALMTGRVGEVRIEGMVGVPRSFEAHEWLVKIIARVQDHGDLRDGMLANAHWSHEAWKLRQRADEWAVAMSEWSTGRDLEGESRWEDFRARVFLRLEAEQRRLELNKHWIGEALGLPLPWITAVPLDAVDVRVDDLLSEGRVETARRTLCDALGKLRPSSVSLKEAADNVVRFASRLAQLGDIDSAAAFVAPHLSLIIKDRGRDDPLTEQALQLVARARGRTFAEERARATGELLSEELSEGSSGGSRINRGGVRLGDSSVSPVPAPLSTMNRLPGYGGAIANPPLSLAIESTRRFLKQADLGGPPKEPLLGQAMFPNWPGNVMPNIDDREQLIKWQAGSRLAVLSFEVLSGMSFVSLPEQGAGYPNGGGLRIQTPLLKNPDGSLREASYELVAMTRPNLEVLQQQARKVDEQANHRLMPKSEDLATRDRLTEITSQVVSQMAFWCAALPIHPDRMPRTIELIDLTLIFTNYASQRFKHALAVPRPNQIDGTVFPAILTPAHASLPSEHSVDAFAVSNLLLSLVSEEIGAHALKERSGSALGKRLLALAARISNNREVAGLHYPVDTFAGRLLGTVLAGYLVARCTGSSYQSGRFDGAELEVDMEGRLMRKGKEVIGPDELGQALVSGADVVCTLGDLGNAIKSEALSWLWDSARTEWGYARGPVNVDNPPQAGSDEHLRTAP